MEGKVRNTTIDEKQKLEVILNRANLLKNTDLYTNDPGVKELVDDALALENEDVESMWDLQFYALYDDLEALMKDFHKEQKYERFVNSEYGND